ncbi:MAG: hypothetical protein GWN01_08150 [Nitrosopumilaceae archaeon]|nr:hypothetical protein [Nitrosopumilaceae archaeon]NIU00891.1 hypothetical protein [Nitrosopumilaceae archaeon]NIU87344.1 hypothetical protein [Nitrosopumilaceae archaeon]NIV65872.1 hypothetical protein [Nitrosopumilaceae archaeon]NIX61493.1 hypothetical protein [Nitrosopumilaceae archaeon]
MKTIVFMIVIFSMVILGILFNSAFASHFTNSAFLTEGSGFAVSDDFIKFSEIDFGLVSKSMTGSRINFSIDDGFVSLDTKEYDSTDLSGSFLRDGKFLRIIGKAEASDGNQIDVRFFGRLIEDSTQGSVYSFTGKITQNNVEYKVIYTSKISEFILEEKPTTSEKKTSQTKILKILQGASTQSFGQNYIDAFERYSQRVKTGQTTVSQYFSEDRISVKPGTTITIVNEDDVSHRIVSGSGGGTHSNFLSGNICSEVRADLPKGFSFVPEGSAGKDCEFTFDGRINTGEIPSGKSVSVTFEEAGFYRLIDPDYPWMRLDGYIFPESISQVIKQGGNQFQN